VLGASLPAACVARRQQLSAACRQVEAGRVGSQRSALANATSCRAESEDTEKMSTGSKSDGRCILLVKHRGSVDHIDFQ